jgi:SAM-dependent methyltransferase
VSDTPFPLPEDGVASRLVAAFDADAKIPRALEALGPVADRDVVLVDADRGYRARQLADLGARVTALVAPARGRGVKAARAREASLRASVADLADRVRVVPGVADATGLPDECADVVIALWSAYRPPAGSAVAEADRILRPDGRLLVVHDYGRDDHVRAEPGIAAETLAWSRRDGWYLTNGFRVRVIHAFWTFADLVEARELLTAAFGEGGGALAEGLSRPRVSHNVAVYHRNRGGDGPSPVQRSRRPDGSAHPGPDGSLGASAGSGDAG